MGVPQPVLVGALQLASGTPERARATAAEALEFARAHGLAAGQRSATALLDAAGKAETTR
jgi:hypothetical protein